MIEVVDLNYSINKKKILKNINFSIESKALISILGPNGAGKSTLLNCLTGLISSSIGDIFINKKNLKNYSLKELAIQRAVLSQSNFMNFPFSAFDIVMMGRYPYIETLAKKENEAIASECLDLLNISHFRDRSYFSLSGGEQQRVQIARVLAQIIHNKESFLFLDEPNNFFDLKYQHQLFSLLNDLVLKKDITIYLVLHNINFAKVYTQQAILMSCGGIFSFGKTSEVLSQENISKVFEIPRDLIPLS